MDTNRHEWKWLRAIATLCLIIFGGSSVFAGPNVIVPILDFQQNPVTNCKCIVTVTTVPASQPQGIVVLAKLNFWTDANGQFVISNAIAANYLVQPVTNNVVSLAFSVPLTNNVTLYAQNLTLVNVDSSQWLSWSAAAGNAFLSSGPGGNRDGSQLTNVTAMVPPNTYDAFGAASSAVANRPRYMQATGIWQILDPTGVNDLFDTNDRTFLNTYEGFLINTNQYTFLAGNNMTVTVITNAAGVVSGSYGTTTTPSFTAGTVTGNWQAGTFTGNGSGLAGLTAAQIGGLGYTTNFVFGGTLDYGSNSFLYGLAITNNLIGVSNMVLEVTNEGGSYDGMYHFWAITNDGGNGNTYIVWTNAIATAEFAIDIAGSAANSAVLAPFYNPGGNNYQSGGHIPNGITPAFGGNGSGGFFTNWASGFGPTKICILTRSREAVPSVQHIVGTFVGGVSNGPVDVGNNGVAAHKINSDQGSPFPPVNADWNAYSREVPWIGIGQWPNLYDDYTFTNVILYTFTNNCHLDYVFFDLSWRSVTNGQIYWTTGRSGSSGNPYGYNTTNNLPITNYVAWLASSNIGSILGLERYHNFDTNVWPNFYDFTSPDLAISQIKTIMDGGFAGVSCDHLLLNNTGLDPSQPVYNQTEMSFFQSIYNGIQQYRGNTNLVANNVTSARMKPFMVNAILYSQFDYAINVANSFIQNDVVIGDNGLGGPFTGAAAEANYVQWYNLNTNNAPYVHPGKFLWGGDIDITTAKFDATNIFNLSALCEASIGITSQSIPWNITNGLQNAGFLSVFYDPAVRFALPVTNFVNGATNITLFAAQVSGTGRYKLGVWNHSGTTTATVSFPARLIDPAFTGNAILQNPWNSLLGFETNSTLTVTNIPPYAIWMYTLQGNAPEANGGSGTVPNGLITNSATGIWTNLSGIDIVSANLVVTNGGIVASNFTLLGGNNDNLILGNHTSLVGSSPTYIDLGGTYSSSLYSGPKLKVYQDFGGNIYCVGVSSGNTYWFNGPSGVNYYWGNGGSDLFRLNGANGIAENHGAYMSSGIYNLNGNNVSFWQNVDGGYSFGSGANGTLRVYDASGNPNDVTLIASNIVTKAVTTTGVVTNAMTTGGWTNNTGTDVRVFEFTGTSVTFSNSIKPWATSLGTISTAQPLIILHNGESLTGTSCAATIIAQ